MVVWYITFIDYSSWMHFTFWIHFSRSSSEISLVNFKTRSVCFKLGETMYKSSTLNQILLLKLYSMLRENVFTFIFFFPRPISTIMVIPRYQGFHFILVFSSFIFKHLPFHYSHNCFLHQLMLLVPSHS